MHSHTNNLLGNFDETIRPEFDILLNGLFEQLIHSAQNTTQSLSIFTQLNNQLTQPEFNDYLQRYPAKLELFYRTTINAAIDSMRDSREKNLPIEPILNQIDNNSLIKNYIDTHAGLQFVINDIKNSSDSQNTLTDSNNGIRSKKKDSFKTYYVKDLNANQITKKLAQFNQNQFQEQATLFTDKLKVNREIFLSYGIQPGILAQIEQCLKIDFTEINTVFERYKLNQDNTSSTENNTSHEAFVNIFKEFQLKIARAEQCMKLLNSLNKFNGNKNINTDRLKTMSAMANELVLDKYTPITDKKINNLISYINSMLASNVAKHAPIKKSFSERIHIDHSPKLYAHKKSTSAPDKLEAATTEIKAADRRANYILASNHPRFFTTKQASCSNTVSEIASESDSDLSPNDRFKKSCCIFNQYNGHENFAQINLVSLENKFCTPDEKILSDIKYNILMMLSLQQQIEKQFIPIVKTVDAFFQQNNIVLSYMKGRVVINSESDKLNLLLKDHLEYYERKHTYDRSKKVCANYVARFNRITTSSNTGITPIEIAQEREEKSNQLKIQ